MRHSIPDYIQLKIDKLEYQLFIDELEFRALRHKIVAFRSQINRLNKQLSNTKT